MFDDNTSPDSNHNSSTSVADPHTEAPGAVAPENTSLAAESAPMQGGIEEQVDPCVAVLGLKLLGELDQAGDRAIHLDRETGRLGLIPREILGRGVPPAHDLRGAMETQQLGLIALGERAQDHGVVFQCPLSG